MTNSNNNNGLSDTDVKNYTAQFRVNRNIMLRKTDPYVMPDRVSDPRWVTFRQKLRDIPQNQPNFIVGLDADYFTEWEWEMFGVLGLGMMD
jgi:hypothetical protein